MVMKVLIVGEASGADEEILKRPFVGVSGCELARMCGEAGFRTATTSWSPALGKYAADWSQSEFTLTNVCQTRPPSNDITAFFAKAKKDRTTSHKLLRDRYVLPPIREGFAILIQTIEQASPNIIIAAGNTAMWALTGRWGVSKWRGSQIEVDTEEMRKWL
jgi:uracil-DNA glycosylase